MQEEIAQTDNKQKATGNVMSRCVSTCLITFRRFGGRFQRNRKSKLDFSTSALERINYTQVFI